MAKHRTKDKIPIVIYDPAKRDCPECRQATIIWADSNKSASSTVTCTDLDCEWRGPYCDSLPQILMSFVGKKPDIRAALIATLESAAEKEVSATQAYEHIYRALIEDADGHADPDEAGRRFFESTATKLTELWVLSQMIDLYGLGTYKDRIMSLNIARRFPTVTLKRG